MDPSTSSVASRFVSQTSLDEAKARRQEEWKAAYERLGQEAPPPPEETEPYDPRSLWEKLKEQKDAKQAAFDEKVAFKNQFRALDEDEISFLDSLTEDNTEEEERRQKEIKDELKGFRQWVFLFSMYFFEKLLRGSNIRRAVVSRSLAPPIASSSSSSLSTPSAISPPLPSSSSTSPSLTPKAAAVPPKKALSKKKDFQKKFLAGVVVKKPAASAGVKRSASGSSVEKGVEKAVGETEEKEKEVGETKKRKVDEEEKEKVAEKAET